MSDRPRRLRRTPGLRRLVRETRLSPAAFVEPLFVAENAKAPKPVASMPGVMQWPLSEIAAQAEESARLGIGAVLLFGISARKDPVGSGAYDPKGVVQEATRAIKRRVSDLVVITDACLCEYTSHGHCGVLNDGSAGKRDPHLDAGYVLNDASVALLQQIAVSQAEAGADIVAPSAMLDGMVRGIRVALDGAGFQHLPIMSYSAKYASAFYGPFRDAAEGAPKQGDRKSHQMDPANAREAQLEHVLDIAEGADILMVKPALSYLDVIHETRRRAGDLPIAAYNVSGEYAMVKAAAQAGWLDERAATLEVLTSIQRAGADIIITYHARQAAQWLNAGTV